MELEHNAVQRTEVRRGLDAIAAELAALTPDRIAGVRALVADPVFREQAFLAAQGVPWPVVMSMDPEVRRIWARTMARFAGVFVDPETGALDFTRRVPKQPWQPRAALRPVLAQACQAEMEP